MRKNKLCLWVPPVIWMGVIFFFSHQPGEESAQLSGRFMVMVEVIANILDMDPTSADLHLMIRKGAHFAEFAILGFLLFPAVLSVNNKRISSFAITLAAGSLYGVLDELHQLFIPGRSCQIGDMIIDAGGVLLAAVLSSLLTPLLFPRSGGSDS